MNISQIKDGYQTKEFSPVEITEKYLNRIENEKDLNAYITVTAERAMNQAKIAEKKIMFDERLGRLEGIPFSIKDNIETAGIVTTNGSIINEKAIPSTNAYVAEKVLQEGAIHLGKTNLPEFVFGVTGNNPHYGFTKNPWNRAYSPGGSSAGTATAITSNLCVASLGTDTSGSIRIPASSCGIVGLKPTYSYIDITGVKKHSWSLDHVGPLAKNMTDLAIMMEVLTNQQYQKECVDDIRGLRIGVPKNYFNEYVDEEVKELFEEALKAFEQMGAILIEVDIPFSKTDADYLLNVVFAETAYSQKNNLEKYNDMIGDYIKNLLKPGYSTTAFEYIEGLINKNRVKRDFETLFEKINLLATPTLPTTAKELEVEEININGVNENILDCMTRFVQVFNLTGQPALSIPCGLTTENLPVGLQLVARSFEDSLLIRAGYTYEQNYLEDFYEKRNAICKTNMDY